MGRTALSVPRDPSIPLEDWLAEDGVRLPRVVLTQLPTRVHLLPRWSANLGAEVWAKRDDETSSLYGGNKPRKLEFIFGDAINRGYGSVLTFGGLGTHHGLATAVFGRELGLKVILGLIYQPVTPAVRENLLCLYALGAKLLFGKSIVRLAAATLREFAWRLWRQDTPYLIPTGGSSPLGTLGYVNAGFELARQVEEGEMPAPRVVFVPLGSGGTVAGLTLGCKLAGLASKVVGVLVTDIFPPTPHRLARLAARTSRYLGAKANSTRAHLEEVDFLIQRGFVGGGYGTQIPEAERLSAWLRDEEGIQLDSTYSAKTAYALECAVRDGRWGPGPYLFWLTFSRARVAERLQPLPDFHVLPTVFHRFFCG